MTPHVPDGFTLYRFNYLKSIETGNTVEVLLPNDYNDMIEELVISFRQAAAENADQIKRMFVNG